MKRMLVVMVMVGLTPGLSAQERRSVLIRSAQPYDGLIAAIEQAGGAVTARFKHVNGIAADLPEAATANRAAGRIGQHRSRRTALRIEADAQVIAIKKH